MSIFDGPDPIGTIHYPLPSTTITLKIIPNETKPIDSQLIYACLSSALAEASEHDQASVVENVFRKASPAEKGVQFGITGGLFCNELTWSDAVLALEGLRQFFGERRQYVSIVVYLSDETRVALGEASVDLISVHVDE